ncbi:hypothetical protein ATANTOWER_011742 [Ataeniobius toweri]|uniref:Secreted protein n=1 Tax=Ataeniobius toweri TaxID=208326 RepID=A0ABU7BF65_9TELE|nr:hypothetical protein [Ataeniobius toweri]
MTNLLFPILTLLHSTGPPSTTSSLQCEKSPSISHISQNALAGRFPIYILRLTFRVIPPPFFYITPYPGIPHSQRPISPLLSLFLHQAQVNHCPCLANGRCY